MKRKGKLKNFQWDTVEAVLNQLEGKSVYSLADEVGLGKTLVLTEVMLQTYLKLKRKPKRYFVFYVAPSHELISQNLHGISKYLKSRLDEEKNT
jgi:superfamily II DNA or RNA helicase